MVAGHGRVGRKRGGCPIPGRYHPRNLMRVPIERT
jgi:hypothetical protein